MFERTNVWAIAALVSAIVGCGGTSAPSDTGSATDGGSAIDAATGVDGGTGLDAGASDAGNDTGRVMLVGMASLPGVPVAMVHDDTANLEYVSLRMMGSGVTMYTGAGIAIVDTTTDTMVGMLPPPTVTGLSPAAQLVLHHLELDAAAHRLYAAGGGGVVFYFDTSARTLGGQFVPGGAGWTLATTGLALDAANHTLWVDSGALFAVDTTTLTSTSTTGGMLTASEPTRGSLALDTTTHTIFQCGRGGSALAACQPFDTTTLAGGAVMAFGPTDTLVGAADAPTVPDAVVAVTVPQRGSSGPAMLYLLEPAPITLPPGFIPTGLDVTRESATDYYVELLGVATMPIDDRSGEITAVGPAALTYHLHGEVPPTYFSASEAHASDVALGWQQFDVGDSFVDPASTTGLDFIVSGSTNDMSGDPGSNVIVHLRQAAPP